MLVFERRQLDAFAQTAFVERMAPLLAGLSLEAQDKPRPASQEEILEQLQRAKAHGFANEQDCARWVLAAWCLGADFHSRIASIAELLAREDVGPGYKALALELMVRAFFVALAGHSRVVL